MFIAHVNRKGLSLHQKIPFPLDVMGSRLEYLIMKLLGKLTDAEWLYRNDITKNAVNWLANRVVIPLIHGEVVTPEEIERIVRRLEEEGHTIALGLCECRHGEKRMEEGLEEGRDPNYTCVMIGDWGKGHLYNYPHDYRPISADELLEITRFWFDRGRVINAWGCSTLHGFFISYCHCLPQYCVPLRHQLLRGNVVFYPGYNYALIDEELCQGPEDCEFNCSLHCHFGAIAAHQGKAKVDISRCHGCGQCFLHCPTGAARGVRKENYELIYCAKDVVYPEG